MIFNCIEEITFRDSREFIEYLDPTHDRWWNHGQEGHWIFRGHGDARWTLNPSAWREDGQRFLTLLRENLRANPSIRLDSLVEQRSEIIRALQLETGLNSDRLIECGLAVAAEYDAVCRFIHLADELGFHIPFHTPQLRRTDISDLIENQFLTPQLIGLYGESFGLAQHHGIPTRLLDFAWKPRIAAFFAAEKAEELCDLPNSPEHFAVWAVNLWDYRGSDVGLSSGSHANHGFLHAQDALFVYCRRPEKFFLENGYWPNVEQLVENALSSGGSKPIRKMTLSIKEAPALLELLRRERITRAHVMPALDNVSHTLKANLLRAAHLK
ncbi:FRG domain-containing protein [Candidatus Sumerlaeota bacterium]|nr:FRG domain-containing protein [Candidatus Sumerlaeota bacterium]